MHKAPEFLLLALLLAVGARPTCAGDITINGLARSASLMRQLAESCPGRVEIDADMAARSLAAFSEAGEKAFGKKKFRAELARETPRRAQEVGDAGAGAWCAAQRDRMLETGGAALFRK